MFSNERYDEIIDILRKNGTVSVAELARRLYASEATIRRDLNELETQGFLKRVHGGAVANAAEGEIPLFLREHERHAEKSQIAGEAVRYITNGATVILDASSTVYHLIPLLTAFENLTVITNGPKTSLALAERHIKSYCTGGFMLSNSLAYTGSSAERMIRGIHADLLFFSCRGLELNGRISDTSPDETAIRQVMLEHATKRICLCDSSKIGKSFLHTVCYVSDIDKLICDRPVPFEPENPPKDYFGK